MIRQNVASNVSQHFGRNLTHSVDSLKKLDVHMSKGGVFSDMSITLSNHNNL